MNTIFSEIKNLSCRIVGIQDTAAEPGRILVREFVSNSKFSEVHVLCYDCISTQLQQSLSGLKKTVHIHDCLPALTPDDSNAEDEIEKFAKFSSINSRYHIVIFDSVSTLFLQKPAHEVYRLVRKLTHSNRLSPHYESILLLHEDTLLNPKPIIAHLKLMCNVWVRVLQGPRVSIAVRKSHGKIYTESYCGTIGNERIVWHKEEDIDAPSKPISNGEPVSTFKLTLSEREKKDRDAVKLPYERQDDQHEEKGSGGATITYEPDEFDDWDEEDPDNDLEFS